jgi:hypothetical protein
MKRFLGCLLCLCGLPLLGATGDPKWATVESNGNWIDVCFTSMGTGGSYTYGATTLIETNGWTNDFRFPGGFITGNDITTVGNLRIDFTSSGFDATGAGVSNPSVSYGTFRKRLAYNNPLTADETVSGSDVICRFALSEKIHSGDTLSSVTTVANLYSQGGNNSTAATLTGSSVTNLSTVPIPRVIAQWGQYANTLTASNDTLRILAFHASATRGNMGISCVKFYARDSAGTYTPTNTVTTGTIDHSYGDQSLVIEFKTTIDYSGLGQGNTISNQFIVYPYRGSSLATEGGDPINFDYGPLITYCNKSNTWKGVYVNVDPAGNNASATATTNIANRLTVTAFTNVALAVQAAGLTNFIFNGASNYGNCYIQLTNGNYAIWGGDSINNRDPSLPWGPVLMPRSDATPSSCIITGLNNALIMNKTAKVMLTNLVINYTANSILLGQGYGNICFDSCTVQTNSGNVAKLADFHTNCWYWHNTFDHYRFALVSGNQDHSWSKFRGNKFTGFSDDASTALINVPFFVGNLILPITNEQYQIVNDNGTSSGFQDLIYDPCIYAFNRMFCSDTAVYAVRIGINTNVTIGSAFIQNVLECTKASSPFPGASIPLDVMNSGKAHETSTHQLFWNNTIVAQYHYPFQLIQTDMTLEDYQDVNNIFCDKELGFDCEQANATYTNRWAGVYSVDTMGNWCSELNNNLYIPGKIEFGYDGIGFGYSTNNPSIIQFANNTSSYGSTATNCNGGDYRLLSTSPLVGRIRTDQRLPFDLYGYPRSGFDPPGAFVAVPVKATAFFGP